MKALFKIIAHLSPWNKNSSTFSIKNNEKYKASLINSRGIASLPKKNTSNQKNFHAQYLEKALPSLPFENGNKFKSFYFESNEASFKDECMAELNGIGKLKSDQKEEKKYPLRSESIYSENNLFFESIVEPGYDRKMPINLDELVYEPKHDIDTGKPKKY